MTLRDERGEVIVGRPQAAKARSTVSTVDVDPQIRAVYGTGGAAPTDPASAAFATYYGNYHGTYEPPFCHAAARTVFDAVK